MIRSERGMITVDYLFAMVLILGFTGLSFVLSFSLSMASVTQYVTFAAARNYVPAHLTEQQQEERAYAKYAELVNHPVIKMLYRNGWYTVDERPTVGDHTSVFPGYKEAAGGEWNQFYGVGTEFVARILDFHIPFFGSTAPDSDGRGDGFKTYIGSYLGREPSAQECLEFTAARWNAIRSLPVSSGTSYSQGTTSSKYYPQADDGC